MAFKCTVIMFAIISLVTFVAAEKVDIPCLGKFPEQLSKAIKGCGVLKAKKSTDPQTLSPEQMAAIRCTIKRLGLINNDGIDSTAVRRLMDRTDNYPTGQKQVIYWKKIKACGFNASDARNERGEEIKFFINCLGEEYWKTCP